MPWTDGPFIVKQNHSRKLQAPPNQLIHSLDSLQKAFDSVPHSWIIQCMQVCKNYPQIVTLIEKAMTLWNTTLILRYLEGKIELPGVKIRRGILQGDSLFSLLFCLALDPLSNLINEQGHRY